jgi:hypothetical protein
LLEQGPQQNPLALNTQSSEGFILASACNAVPGTAPSGMLSLAIFL